MGYALHFIFLLYAHFMFQGAVVNIWLSIMWQNYYEKNEYTFNFLKFKNFSLSREGFYKNKLLNVP